MTAQYFTVLTDYGTQAFAKALATNQPLRLSSFAVGDGNGQAVTPTADRTALVKEVHRANVSAVSLDPRNNKQIIIELTIPEDVGGFYIREMGVFDSTNKLVAYANTPESFKPTVESGSGKVQVLRMILKVSNSQAVTLSIDNSVIFVTRQQLTPQKITSSTTNGFDESGHTHEIEKADTTKAGIVQLTDDTGLDSDKLGLSARAGKKLAQLISTVQLALGNYIQNNKKSNSVTSNSNDNVATSSAVKTAYDKGVEAKTAADNAQRSANDGINRANNAQTSANQAKSAADAAQRTANDGVSKATTAQNTANSAVTKADNAQRAADNANNNANNRVSKSGDTMTGNLVIKNGSPWSSVVLDNNQGQGIKLESRPNDDVFMGEISYLDIHNGYRNINTLCLPKKSGTLALEADVNGKAPLSDFEIVKNNYYDKFGFAERAYPSHYNGAHVWTMRFNQFGGVRIIQLRAEIKNSSGTVPIYLPEEMTTQSLSIATDDGYVRYSYGSKVTSNNIVTVYTPQNKTAGINLFVIGWVNF